MAFDLLNFVSNKINTEATAASTTQTITIDPAEAQKIFSAIRSLMPGQTIQGELIQKEGNNIQLLLNNDVVFNTKLSEDLSLNMGQVMTFEVKGNKNGQLVLRPLFENVSQDPNAVKALEAASIKVNDKTLNMVNELMKEGMPINKDILATVNRQMNLFNEAELSDIVLLNKMNLPVNENTLNQVHLYQNNNQWMMENLTEFTNQVMQLLDDTFAGEPNAGMELLNNLLQVFSEDNLSQSQTILTTVLPETSENPLQELQKMTTEIEGEVPNKENVDSKVIANDIQTSIDIMAKNPKLSHIPEHAVRGAMEKELLFLMKNEMLMKPEQISEDGYVKQYYEKLHDISSKLEALMKDSGKSESTFAKSVTQLKSNVEFMNQINETYHYIQLPLKMNERQANGELYVYSKKKTKINDDGNLTALLHLSMEHLGNMDIFLSLKQDRLSTKFCLEKEEMLDFIEEHIDELNARLNKKGYVTDTKIGLMEKKEQDVIHTILNEEPQPVILSKQSFDARA